MWCGPTTPRRSSSGTSTALPPSINCPTSPSFSTHCPAAAKLTATAITRKTGSGRTGRRNSSVPERVLILPQTTSPRRRPRGRHAFAPDPRHRRWGEDTRGGVRSDRPPARNGLQEDSHHPAHHGRLFREYLGVSESSLRRVPPCTPRQK